jgi:Ca-activated chloride channel family protein
MRFGEPHYLWLLATAPVVAVLLLIAWRRRERDLARWCAPGLWDRLIPGRRRHPGWWRILLLSLGVLALALTAARPQLGSRILSVERKGIDLMIALDLSESMLAGDLAPDRLTRARQEVESLIDRLRGDRVGLVVFSGEAFVQCPLTLDYAAARMFLRLMNTELIRHRRSDPHGDPSVRFRGAEVQGPRPHHRRRRP